MVLVFLGIMSSIQIDTAQTSLNQCFLFLSPMTSKLHQTFISWMDKFTHIHILAKLCWPENYSVSFDIYLIRYIISVIRFYSLNLRGNLTFLSSFSSIPTKLRDHIYGTIYLCRSFISVIHYTDLEIQMW